MITVICGTNRINNETRKLCTAYCDALTAKGIEHKYFSLEDLPKDFAFNNEVMGDDALEFRSVVEKYILPADKFIFATPEYNGSFPGVAKSFLDAIKPADLKGKKIALSGLSAGRSGNLRGLDQLTNICNYLGLIVLPTKMILPKIFELVNEDTVTDKDTNDFIKIHIDELLAL